MFEQIVLAVSHIHKNKYIHRDLCPENIFLDINDNIKIGDFGRAKLLDESGCTKNSDGDGHKLYMAPEDEQPYGMELASFDGYYTGEEKKETEVCAKSDLYSLGLILTELLHPFRNKKARYSVFESLKHENVCPDGWDVDKNLILKLLARKASDRPTVEEILEELKMISSKYPESTKSNQEPDMAAGRDIQFTDLKIVERF